MPTARLFASMTPGPVQVVVLLVIAHVAAVGAGTLLIRPEVSVRTAAIHKATEEVRPGDGTSHGAARGMHLYLLPHPDDELSGWTSLTDDENLYPVIVLLTQGEATRRCQPEVFRRHFRIEVGEVAPEPRPDRAGGTLACQEARLGSFRSALTAAQGSSPDVAGLGVARLENLPGVARGRYVALDNAALVVLDLPDQGLTATTVLEAATSVLARVGHELPDLTLTRATAAAYSVSPDTDSTKQCDQPVLCPSDDEAFPYPNADHVAVRKAVRALAPRTTEGSWLVTTPYDPAASVFRALPQDIYDEFLALGPGERRDAARLGIYQQVYGWLAFPDVWRPGDLPLKSERVIFSRVQAFEVVGP